ncbi:hypothetical protein [Acidovorax sp.]|uniref:hypothetical protein n=1 Tax=Acidovorax sp. TaxID=1872122 RepID=UPI002ACEAD03|nr:hypothetical protein [Acidovorax sp.]MDZ7863359.1 hypothetical protein [Acidovorax sp.]
MSASTAQPGTPCKAGPMASEVFDRAFFAGRERRSDAYKAGVLQTLRNRLEGVPFSPAIYAAGSAERDAFFAGADEGRMLAAAAKESAA